jgi:hypothetical protein
MGDNVMRLLCIFDGTKIDENAHLQIYAVSLVFSTATYLLQQVRLTLIHSGSMMKYRGIIYQNTWLRVSPVWQ